MGDAEDADEYDGTDSEAVASHEDEKCSDGESSSDDDNEESDDDDSPGLDALYSKGVLSNNDPNDEDFEEAEEANVNKQDDGEISASEEEHEEISERTSKK